MFEAESARFCFTGSEGGDEALAFHGLDLVAVELLRVGGAGGIDEGGHEVDEVGDLVAEFALGFDAGGPMDDEGGADAAFVIFAFVSAEGGVGESRPAFAVAGRPTAEATPFFIVVDGVGVALDAEEGFLLGAAVVGDEDDQCVVEFADFFQVVDDAADVLVEAVDDGGEEGHFEIEVVACFSVSDSQSATARGRGASGSGGCPF